MKSLQTSMLLIVAGLMITACNKVSHKKTPGGMPYQLYRGKGSQDIRQGNIVKLHFTQKIKDSVYFTSRDKLPIYWPVNNQTSPYDISELWTSLRKGDSVIATQLMDTFIKRNPDMVRMNPQFKKGDMIVSTIKIIDVFENDSVARADEEKERDAWLVKETAFLQDYLAERKINAQKTKSGAFVEIKNPGQGDLIDSGKYVSVKYTGTSFSGKVFDSNIDTAFHHTDPLVFPVGVGQMIKGFDEAMFLLRPGAQARIYIPSILGYGGRPNSPDIKPFEHLIFDIEVLNVTQEAPAPPQRPNVRPGAKIDTPQQK